MKPKEQNIKRSVSLSMQECFNILNAMQGSLEMSIKHGLKHHDQIEQDYFPEYLEEYIDIYIRFYEHGMLESSDDTDPLHVLSEYAKICTPKQFEEAAAVYGKMIEIRPDLNSEFLLIKEALTKK